MGLVGYHVTMYENRFASRRLHALQAAAFKILKFNTVVQNSGCL